MKEILRWWDDENDKKRLTLKDRKKITIWQMRTYCKLFQSYVRYVKDYDLRVVCENGKDEAYNRYCGNGKKKWLLCYEKFGLLNCDREGIHGTIFQKPRGHGGSVFDCYVNLSFNVRLSGIGRKLDRGLEMGQYRCAPCRIVVRFITRYPRIIGCLQKLNIIKTGFSQSKYEGFNATENRRRPWSLGKKERLGQKIRNRENEKLIRGQGVNELESSKNGKTLQTCKTFYIL